MSQRPRSLRQWLRHLEPRLLGHLQGPMMSRARPWLDRHDVFSFSRTPLAKGVAIGMFCGLIPGPFQMPSTFVVCAALRGNALAGALTTLYTNPLTIVPLYVLAFQLGALVLPGSHALPALPAMSAHPSEFWAALSSWVQALGWPLATGLPMLGLLFAALGYGAVQALCLWPAWRRLARLRAHRAH